MDLALTDDQRFIRQEARRLLADKSSSQAVRRTIEDGTGFDAALWTTIAGELGWCAMAVPEEHGGLGLGLVELMILMEALGERLAAVPFWSTACVAAPLLMAVGSEEARARHLPDLASGRTAATVAWERLDAARPLWAAQITAIAQADGYRLDGKVGQVVDLEAADLVLVPAMFDGGQALFALPRELGYETRRLDTLDSTRQIGELTLRGLQVPAVCRVDADGIDASAALGAIATAQLGLAAEQVGAARGVMDLTLAYVSERVQFGRTIASFQAIKHRCALLEVGLAEARAMVYGAAASLAGASAEDRLVETSGARMLASELLYRASEEAIQLHGGVGFTWEYDPHLYFKRAQAACSLLGSEEQHLEVIAAHVLGAAK